MNIAECLAIRVKLIRITIIFFVESVHVVNNKTLSKVLELRRIINQLSGKDLKTSCTIQTQQILKRFVASLVNPSVILQKAYKYQHDEDISLKQSPTEISSKDQQIGSLIKVVLPYQAHVDRLSRVTNVRDKRVILTEVFFLSRGIKYLETGYCVADLHLL